MGLGTRRGRWVLMSAVMSAMMLTGCFGTREEPQAAENSPAAPKSSASAVVLKMLLLGSRPADFDEVYDAVNQIMKHKINATLDVSFIDWGDNAQKYPALFAAKENVDLVYSASWNMYSQIATKNGFKELTEAFIKTYAPETWKQEPKEAWEQAKVNGKIFMVPQNSFGYGQKLIAVRGDLRKKHGVPEIKTLEDYHHYLEVIRSKEAGMMPSMGAGEGNGVEFIQPNELFVLQSPLPFVVKMTEPSSRVFNYVDIPEYAAFVQQMYQTANAGGWDKEVIVSKIDRVQAFKDGKLASFEWNLGNVLNAKSIIKTSHPDWDIEIVDISADKKVFAVPFIGNGMSIPAVSKNPERALMALDLLRYDQEIHDLTNFGIKGKHYEAIGDDQYKSLPASSGFPPGGVSPWGWSTSNERMDVDSAAEAKQVVEKFKKNTIHHPLEPFVFDDSKVKNEGTAITTVMNAYGKPLAYGLVDPQDAEHGIKAFQEKLKQAGSEKYMQEVQEQVDAFIQAARPK